MKTLKRIIAVAVIILIALTISYLIYTGVQVNAQGNKYHIYTNDKRRAGTARRVCFQLVLSSALGNAARFRAVYRVLLL